MTKKYTFVLGALMIAAMLVMPADTFAKNNKDNKGKSGEGSSHCKAWGHFIAPGWLKKNSKPNAEDCEDRMPRGIWFKIFGGTNGGDNDNDDDDNDGDDTDTVAPRFSSIYVASRTATSATIKVITNEAAIAQIAYGTSDSYGSNTTKTTEFKTNQNVVLSGLTANTTYHYKVTVWDDESNSRTSGDRTFKTRTTSDVTAPVISDISAHTITTASATIVWTTNENASTKINYGTSDSYGTEINDATLVTAHSKVISGLTANTTYHYKVTSVDGAGNVTVSADKTFTTSATGDVTQPIISNIVIDSITSSSASISWDTDEQTTTNLYWSTVSPVNKVTDSKLVDNTLRTSHDMSLTGLSNDTNYYFLIESKDSSGNMTTAAQGSFETNL